MNTLIPSRSIRIARCEVSGRSFGLDLSAIVGIQPRDVVRFEAGETDAVVGTMSSLGRQLPVYSLARLLGLSDSDKHSGHCIVTTDGVDVWGLLVDRVSHSESRTTNDLIPLPPLITGSSGAMIQGVVSNAGDQEPPLIVLELKKLRPQSLAANTLGEAPADLIAAPLIDGTPSPQATRRRLITFAPASEARDSSTRFAFSVSQVAEITRVPNFVAIPRSPDFVVGLATWRQGPLPIVRLGSTSTPVAVDSTTRLAIVKVPESPLPLGLLVNAECELLSCPLTGTPVAASATGQSDQRVRAAFRVGSQTLLFPRFQATGPA